MIKKLPCFLLLSLITVITIQAQVPFFHQYFLLKKNEAVHVNTIFQDNEGFVWFGTNKGLFKFDGKKYHRFSQLDSLPDDHVTALAQDSTGRIWTGHKNGKVAFLEKGVGHAFETQEGSATEEISDILFDRKGNLWFSTLNDGLYYFTRNRLYRLDEKEGMPDLFVYDIEEDSQGNIWAGTDGGVAICSLQDSMVNIEVLNYDDGLADNIVKKIILTKNNLAWFATEDAGIIGYNPVDRKLHLLLNRQWPYGSVSDFVLKDDKFWISTLRSGLLVFDHKSGTMKQYDAGSLTALSPIHTLLKDKEGNIWAGSKTTVLRTAGDHIEFIESLDPANNNVIALAADKKGCIWFSTEDGLFKRCLDDGVPVIQKQLAGTSFQQYTVISLFVDSAEYVWAGLYGEGVLRINPSNGKIKYLNKELRNGNVLHITGKNDVVWLATLGGSEQITISGEKLSIKNYNAQNGLSSDFIYQVFLDSKGNVWFATDGKGVDKMDESGFHHFEEGLTSKVVYGFAEDRNHTIWINVQDNGLYKFNGQKFQPIDTTFQIRDNNINCFAADSAGNIIVMHDLGIDIYNVKSKRMRYLGDEAGIRSKKATLNALAKDGHGNLYMGTDGGIIQFRLDEEVTRSIPEVVIDEVRIFDQAIDIAHDKILQYDENSITINFLGFWFQDPESIHFLYKLDNYDTDWIATRDNSVTYSKLPPGEYTFRVKVSATEDFSQAKEATVSFSIRPPFWRTAAFYTISIIIVIATAYVYIKFREKKLIQDMMVLEAKVEERTLEIQRKTEEIVAQNEEITTQTEEIKGINENLEMLVKQRTAELEKKNKALAEYSFINAHKLRSPVASILGLINLISKTELSEEAKLINQHLQQSADELDDIVRSITEAIERGEK